MTPYSGLLRISKRTALGAALAVALTGAPPAAALFGQSAVAEPALQSLGQRPRIAGERLLRDLGAIAHDSMEGRRTGTPGAERARAFLVQAFESRGVEPLGSERTRSFQVTSRGNQLEGVNVFGLVRGTVHTDRYIVVTAHYDHLGVQGGQVFNGADDNGSGTAAILALADWLQRNPPSHSFLFVAFDAEEMGLQGARAFTANPPVPLNSIVMNVNLDMVSRSAVRELYAAGTYHYPVLSPLVAEVAAVSRITLLTGHDRPGLPPGDDWTGSSDHGPFHQAGVPFIYFGVEDHPGYHQPTDVVEDITPDFYVEAVETILDFLLTVDRNGERVLGSRAP